MTVRTWFTISALVVAALTGAFVYRLLQPLAFPEVILRSGDVRIEGDLAASCWPKRGPELRCTRKDAEPASRSTIPSAGTFRFIVTFPAQPEDGEIRIDGPTRLKLDDWRQSLAYELAPGSYTLRARGEYPNDAYVSYLFRFRVTRSGS